MTPEQSLWSDNVIPVDNPADGFSMSFVQASKGLNRYVTTEEDARHISKLLPKETYPCLLDVCCGFGRFSGALHKLGYQVTGLDLSQDQIEEARRSNPGPDYIVTDMCHLPDRRFDAVINMYTSFGYYKTEEEDLRALDAWGAALRSGGKLVMELADMDRARAKLDRTKPIIYRYTGDVTEEVRMDWTNRILEVTYLQEDRRFTCHTRLYEKEFLVGYLRGIGFGEVAVYGDLEGKPKALEDNLILIATKK
ncbi:MULTISPECIES: class I SAM-dependent methyltransferase [Paenibacillus]|uniref:class I SAM-dependent methyltransferase n=1 Tax=Paenibacillus TaxID=44249 RepID=UPI0022B8CE03|nr:class I SAM-dependent methyltransferase [Paenibacillus caseinilyticus]MCZ8522862.1 class I SAM-dependent methyltransferase [Paenibacillus caseinilyticus]